MGKITRMAGMLSVVAALHFMSACGGSSFGDLIKACNSSSSNDSSECKDANAKLSDLQKSCDSGDKGACEELDKNGYGSSSDGSDGGSDDSSDGGFDDSEE